eukprot:5985372-Lingulodinium_polyedra.AAC.1
MGAPRRRPLAASSAPPRSASIRWWPSSPANSRQSPSEWRRWLVLPKGVVRTGPVRRARAQGTGPAAASAA